MRSVESSAKTMEEAVTLGLEKLGVSFSDVKIDILDEGSKGFLGFLGGKPVVVRLTVREDEEAVQMPSVTMDAPKTDRKKEAKKPAPKKTEAAVKAEPKAETIARPAPKAARRKLLPAAPRKRPGPSWRM